MSSRRSMPIMIFAIIMIGCFLRLYHLTQVPLRGDEAFTVQYWARIPLSDSLAHTATMEPHPVLTYALFRGWGLVAGTSEFAMRLLPALLGMLGIPAVYAMGRYIGGKQVALLAALLFALHPFEIWHAQDARNNAIWAGMSALTLALGLRALYRQHRSDWLLYGLCASITANIFYFEWFTLAAFGIYVFIVHWKRWDVFSTWLLAVLPAFITSIASFILLQGNLIASGAYGGTTASKLDLPRLLTWFLPTLNFGERTLPTGFAEGLWPFIALAFVLAIAFLLRQKRNAAIFLLAVSLIPLLFLALASLKLNIFNPRYILSSIPAYVLAFAVLIVRSGDFIKKSKVRWLPGLIILVLWFAVAGFSLYNYYFIPSPAYAKAVDWPALNHFLQNEVSERDLVIQLSADPAFGYYYLAPANAPALPEKPSQPISEIEQILMGDSLQYENIWTVGQTFPDWPNTGVVENWLDTHMQLIRRGQIDGLNYRQYEPWQVNTADTQAPLATFGASIQLVGVRVLNPPVPTGDLTVVLVWRPLKLTEVPFKVFVHLIGPLNPSTGSPLWSQDDDFPQNGRANTDTWKVDQLYRDVYTLPLSAVPAGSYTLHVGFYKPTTSQRLAVGENDFFNLQTLDLK